MDSIKKTKEALIEYLESLSESDLMEAHRQMCENCNYSDSEIYENDEEFFNLYFQNDPDAAVRATFFGDYRYGDNYVVFNGYANLESSNDIMDFIDLSDIADDILENENDYNVEFEEEPTKVSIRKEEDGSYSIVDDEGDVVSDEFEKYEDAVDWLEGDNDYILVN